LIHHFNSTILEKIYSSLDNFAKTQIMKNLAKCFIVNKLYKENNFYFSSGEELDIQLDKL